MLLMIPFGTQTREDVTSNTMNVRKEGVEGRSGGIGRKMVDQVVVGKKGRREKVRGKGRE